MSANEVPAEDRTGPKGWAVREMVMAGVIAALVATNGYTLYRSEEAKGELQNLDASFRARILSERETTTASNQETRRALDQIAQQLSEAKGESQAIVQKANQVSFAARQKAEQLAKRFAEEQKKQQAAFAIQLGELKDTTETANASASTKISGLLTDVSSVRTDVASTRTDLDRTVSDLRSVRGDLGVQSGLIATNSRELDALKALGARNYYEFDLAKASKPQIVGGVTVQLKRADIKRNRYTIEVLADDKRVEKKDKTVNEPVQFYSARARVPYEIVVNEVRRDRIVGYLATPKMQDTR
jgi:hypothetical protein